MHIRNVLNQLMKLNPSKRKLEYLIQYHSDHKKETYEVCVILFTWNEKYNLMTLNNEISPRPSV